MEQRTARRFWEKAGPEALLAVILIVAFGLRVYKLSYQSLWLDELHLMNEADPSIAWKEMIHYLQCCDIQPPLYFIFERLAFTLFGYNEFVARMVTAVGGTLGVWAMYLLGKEILSKRLGLLCAAIACFNYFSIHYSQDARPYIFSFLFATLSFVYFLKALKQPTLKAGVLYALWTLVFLFTHYYSLFCVTAQALLALLFLLRERGGERKALFRTFLIGGIIIILGYAAWVPILLSIDQGAQSWIPSPAPDFLQSYFAEYFGNVPLLHPLLILLMIAFMAGVALSARKAKVVQVRTQPVLRCFVIVLVWISLGYLLPYLRSLTATPMLFPRYTIVVLPAVILVVAYGLEMFRVALIRNLLLACLLFIAFADLLVVKKYYSSIHKTQFREMTEFLVSGNKANYPVINEITPWHHGYYLRKYQSKAEVWSGKKEDIIDSILQKNSVKYDVKGFWIVGAHNDKKPDSVKLQTLSAQYELAAQKDFFDAWAMFYKAKPQSNDEAGR